MVYKKWGSLKEGKPANAFEMPSCEINLLQKTRSLFEEKVSNLYFTPFKSIASYISITSDNGMITIWEERELQELD